MKRACSVLLSCLVVMLGCDPVALRGVAVSPGMTAGGDSLRRSALVMTARIAAQNALDRRPDLSAAAWHDCFAAPEGGWWLCDRLFDGEVQLQIYAPLKRKLPSMAEHLRRELVDSLSAEFGPAVVQDCQWQTSNQTSGWICRKRK